MGAGLLVFKWNIYSDAIPYTIDAIIERCRINVKKKRRMLLFSDTKIVKNTVDNVFRNRFTRDESESVKCAPNIYSNEIPRKLKVSGTFRLYQAHLRLP